MYKERFSMPNELKNELIALGEKLDELKGSKIIETEIDENGWVTILFEDGKSLGFGVTSENLYSVDHVEIKS